MLKIAGFVILRASHANTHDLCGQLSQSCMHIDIQVYSLVVENSNDLEVILALKYILTRLIFFSPILFFEIIIFKYCLTQV